MPDWELSIEVDAPPDEVWAFIGDPTTVPRWYPKYVTCEVDGETRTLRSAEGAELVERLLERDEARRSYAYSVLSGAPVSAHRASFEVVPSGAGSRVVWRTEAEPSDP
ncbi:MAG TPA: SRPBCC family protein, partial [Gaiellaceae bacterium]|nr:SRPBCC family protein [Gaiellaceae bacterium]